jgi:hypothetical protein
MKAARWRGACWRARWTGTCRDQRAHRCELPSTARVRRGTCVWSRRGPAPPRLLSEHQLDVGRLARRALVIEVDVRVPVPGAYRLEPWPGALRSGR